MPGSRLSFQPAPSPFFLSVLPRVQLFLTHSCFCWRVPVAGRNVGEGQGKGSAERLRNLPAVRTVHRGLATLLGSRKAGQSEDLLGPRTPDRTGPELRKGQRGGRGKGQGQQLAVRYSQLGDGRGLPSAHLPFLLSLGLGGRASSHCEH